MISQYALPESLLHTYMLSCMTCLPNCQMNTLVQLNHNTQLVVKLQYFPKYGSVYYPTSGDDGLGLPNEATGALTKRVYTRPG